ncbi:MAG: lactoylglutathione lyase [Kangiellaceae bacterium]|nr:lactoylglutathione lyase [Kangiellaceae bacterium]
MLRVRELNRSEYFYRKFLGMEVLRKKDYPDGEFTLSFLGYGDEQSNTILELTHNWHESDYEKGSGYGHIALAVDDIYQTCKFLEENDIVISRQPGPMKSDVSEVIAFIEDPDGYPIELIERS